MALIDPMYSFVGKTISHHCNAFLSIRQFCGSKGSSPQFYNVLTILRRYVARDNKDWMCACCTINNGRGEPTTALFPKWCVAYRVCDGDTWFVTGESCLCVSYHQRCRRCALCILVGQIFPEAESAKSSFYDDKRLARTWYVVGLSSTKYWYDGVLP